MNTTTAPTRWQYLERIVASDVDEAVTLIRQHAERNVPYATFRTLEVRETSRGRFSIRVERDWATYARDAVNGNRAHRIEYPEPRVARTVCGEDIESLGTVGNWDDLSGDDALCTHCAFGIRPR